MSNVQLEKNDEGIIAVSGTLGFDLVSDMLEHSRPFFAGKDALVFNLSAVEKTDSAGLALLIEWMVMAKKRVRLFHFKECQNK
jgi:Predicted NTP binding protein (contains STAS domain)